MLNAFGGLLDGMAAVQPDFTPARYGLLTACDGGLLEVSGLSVPIGTMCRIGSLGAEVIGFRGSNTLSRPVRTP